MTAAKISLKKAARRWNLIGNQIMKKYLVSEIDELMIQRDEWELNTALLSCELGFKTCEDGGNLESAKMAIVKFLKDAVRCR